MKILPEQLIMGSAIKYATLSNLIAMSFAGSNCTEINLFIDMNSLLKKLYSVKEMELDNSDPYGLTAAIINLCGHYRVYFNSIGVMTNIYIIYGLNCPKMNETYIKDYNARSMADYMRKRDTTEIVNNNIRILKLLCQYLPKIHFFDIGYNETSTMVDYILKNIWLGKQINVENIILSKDVLMLQLIPSYNVRVLRPYKTPEQGDLSYIIDNNNLWQIYCANYRKTIMPKEIIPTGFFQNVLPMTRIPERNIYAMLNLGKCFTVIHSGIEVGFLQNDNRLYTQDVLNNILEAMDVPCNKPELIMRYRAVNPNYQSSYVLLMENPELKYLRLIEMNDPKSLNEICGKYFDNNPINLEALI